MAEWSMEELQEWDNKICKLGESLGLDWYPIEYEICDYKEMIGHMAYTGLANSLPPLVIWKII